MFFERLLFVVSRMNEDEPFAKFLLDFFFSTESYHFFDLLSFLTYCLVAFVLGLFFATSSATSRRFIRIPASGCP